MNSRALSDKPLPVISGGSSGIGLEPAAEDIQASEANVQTLAVDLATYDADGFHFYAILRK